MYIKSSICSIQHTCINFLIFLIITKIECWPVFKQDPYFYSPCACNPHIGARASVALRHVPLLPVPEALARPSPTPPCIFSALQNYLLFDKRK